MLDIPEVGGGAEWTFTVTSLLGFRISLWSQLADRYIQESGSKNSPLLPPFLLRIFLANSLIVEASFPFLEASSIHERQSAHAAGFQMNCSWSKQIECLKHLCLLLQHLLDMVTNPGKECNEMGIK